jgi:thioredoxin reductase (NADPH)
MYDIIIIGGGAAGMSAAIYAGRSGVKTLVIEAMSAGGQMNLTYEIDNYPGIPNAPAGEELSAVIKEHALKFDVEFTTETVKEIIGADEEIKKIVTRKNIYEAKTIIFATGANPRKLGADGEDKFYGTGVSYCATCDGAFFKGQDTAVVGGGNTAFEDALYLARFAKSVYLIHRRTGFRAEGRMVEAAKRNPKIKFVLNAEVEKISGDTTVNSLTVTDTVTGRKTDIAVSGVFIAVGRDANSALAGKYVRLDSEGFIMTDRYMQTNIRGIFAAGDVRDTPLRQVITAAADGAVAATSAIHYLNA